MWKNSKEKDGRRGSVGWGEVRDGKENNWKRDSIFLQKIAQNFHEMNPRLLLKAHYLLLQGRKCRHFCLLFGN
jgi:hypothetical protein